MFQITKILAKTFYTKVSIRTTSRVITKVPGGQISLVEPSSVRSGHASIVNRRYFLNNPRTGKQPHDIIDSVSEKIHLLHFGKMRYK